MTAKSTYDVAFASFSQMIRESGGPTRLNAKTCFLMLSAAGTAAFGVLGSQKEASWMAYCAILVSQFFCGLMIYLSDRTTLNLNHVQDHVEPDREPEHEQHPEPEPEPDHAEPSAEPDAAGKPEEPPAKKRESKPGGDRRSRPGHTGRAA